MITQSFENFCVPGTMHPFNFGLQVRLSCLRIQAYIMRWRDLRRPHSSSLTSPTTRLSQPLTPQSPSMEAHTVFSSLEEFQKEVERALKTDDASLLPPDEPDTCNIADRITYQAPCQQSDGSAVMVGIDSVGILETPGCHSLTRQRYVYAKKKDPEPSWPM